MPEPADQTAPAAATTRSILCVDDDANQLLAYEALLSPLSAELVMSPGPDEALQTLATRTFDLVILDVTMPGMSGFDLAVAIRQRFPAMTVAPILFVSALDRRFHVDTAMKAGGDDFLTKPVSGKVLRQHVQRLLSVSGMTDPLERHQAYLKLKASDPLDDDLQ
ncbi:MAG: two-component system response regulator [Planctomycetota bacterium]